MKKEHEHLMTGLAEQPYLTIHPTDTDHHAAEKILFINKKNRIVGPLISNGDNVSVSFQKPEIYEFDRSDGTSLKFLVQSIEGNVEFSYERFDNGEVKRSAPTHVGFIDGYFMAIDPKTGETWKQEYQNCKIALRAHEGDMIKVSPKAS